MGLFHSPITGVDESVVRVWTSAEMMDVGGKAAEYSSSEQERSAISHRAQVCQKSNAAAAE